MKTDTIQQEILLVTTSTFSKQQWCSKDTADNGGHHYSPAEQLEEACWNGLLDQLLPEIMEKSSSGKELYLWHIRQGASYLQIELSEFPKLVEKPFSIYPNFFLHTISFN